MEPNQNSNPRRADVWGKKPEVADRTINERKFCKVCEYYYSEMFTCPICYGADREQERIIKLLHEKAAVNWIEALEYPYYADELEALIKGEQK